MSTHADTDPPTSPPAVLRAVRAADPGPWFPADYALVVGVPRDALYEPVTELLRAGRIRVVDWVKGRGQGYAAEAEADETPAPTPKRLSDEMPRQRSPLTTFDRGELARAAILNPRPAIITPALLIVNGLWFAVGLALVAARGETTAYLKGTDLDALANLGGAAGVDLVRGEWWRLATCGFVHAGLLHVALNLFALGSLGPMAEAVWGRWRFAVIFFVSSLGGACFGVAVEPNGRLVGASAGACGLLGAAGAWLLLYREHLPTGVVADWMQSLVIGAAATAAVSLAPQVSWAGHLGGAVVGFTAAVLANVVRPGLVRKRVMVPAAAALALLPAVCVAGLTLYASVAVDWARVRDRAAEPVAAVRPAKS